METFSAGREDRRLRQALADLGFGEWALANVYSFVYDLSVDIEPEGREPEEWRFSGPALARAKKAIRLESELEVNLNAVAIILELLDEIDELRAAVGRRGR